MEEKEKEVPVDVETTTVSTENVDGSVTTDTESVSTLPSGRERITERLRTYNPDGVYDEDEDFYNGVGTLLDERDAMSQNSKQLAEVFSRSPQAASFFIDLMDGKGIYESLSRNFGPDLMAAIEAGGDEASEYDRGLAEWETQRAERESRTNEFKSNSDAAMAEYDAWLAENGYSPEERASLEDEIMSMTNDMGVGKFMNMVKALHRSRKYDADIEAARAEGEIRGRNARIAEERTMPTRGDGLPVMQREARSEEEVAAPQQGNGWRW